MKIFYMIPLSKLIGTIVNAGDKLGTAQDLTKKYPGITNHIHLEIKKNGVIIDPKKIM